MIKDAVVIDAVGHSYNLDASNVAHPDGEYIRQTLIEQCQWVSAPEYTVTAEQLATDWSLKDTVSVFFRESNTDFVVYHPTPVNVFHDGLVSVAKAREARERWPDRVLAYATVDALGGREACDELERQYEWLEPIGLKLYPSSWREKEHRGWRMNDPEVAYPIFEKARELGLKMIAIHKNIPFGPVPMEPYRVDDIDVAAAAFPDLNFEIVHGGMAFLEETAWLVGRFPNVYVNFEGLNFMAAMRPGAFQHALRVICGVGGPAVLDRCFWATGAISCHPQPFLLAFADMVFTEAGAAEDGLLLPLPTLSWEQKRGILGENYARAVGLDLAKMMGAIEGDEFSGVGELSAPWSTTAWASSNVATN